MLQLLRPEKGRSPAPALRFESLDNSVAERISCAHLTFRGALEQFFGLSTCGGERCSPSQHSCQELAPIKTGMNNLTSRFYTRCDSLSLGEQQWGVVVDADINAFSSMPGTASLRVICARLRKCPPAVRSWWLLTPLPGPRGYTTHGDVPNGSIVS